MRLVYYYYNNYVLNTETAMHMAGRFNIVLYVHTYTRHLSNLPWPNLASSRCKGGQRKLKPAARKPPRAMVYVRKYIHAPRVLSRTVCTVVVCTLQMHCANVLREEKRQGKRKWNSKRDTLCTWIRRGRTNNPPRSSSFETCIATEVFFLPVLPSTIVLLLHSRLT